MKKLIAICMVLMLCAASAYAAEWPEGYSPAHPFENGPEFDLETELGLVMCYPNAKYVEVGGGRLLFIYLPREDVKAGAGMLHIRTADQGEEWSVAMNDTEHVKQRAMYEQEMMDLMWGSGTCFEITLPVSLRLGATYYIDMDTYCIEAGEKIGNKQNKGDEVGAWQFAVDGTLGVNEMSYRRAKDDGSYENVVKPAAGDEIRFDLVIGGDVALAVLYVYDGAEFEVTNYTESCEIIGTVTGEDPDWGVVFLDATGNEIAYVEF
ncbi:MAG: hypothetical protein J1E43_11835 [Christensenellaceae bacterium]|nr:hypothetical protein [Christensenellaceae bacterium]